MTFFLDFAFIIVFFFLTLVKDHLTTAWFLFSEDWCLKLSNLIHSPYANLPQSHTLATGASAVGEHGEKPFIFSLRLRASVARLRNSSYSV
jgi:hypothetical protein